MDWELQARAKGRWDRAWCSPQGKRTPPPRKQCAAFLPAPYSVPHNALSMPAFCRGVSEFAAFPPPIRDLPLCRHSNLRLLRGLYGEFQPEFVTVSARTILSGSSAIFAPTSDSETHPPGEAQPGVYFPEHCCLVGGKPQRLPRKRDQLQKRRLGQPAREHQAPVLSKSLTASEVQTSMRPESAPRKKPSPKSAFCISTTSR